MMTVIGKLAAAYALALPIAIHREASQRSAGLRTFPLVAVTSCAYLLIAVRFYPEGAESNARLMQGLIGGLGFLGGGAILKSEGEVNGMATATSIWACGALGMACAYGAWEIAAVLAACNLFTLLVGTWLKKFFTPVEEKKSDGNDDRPAAD